MNQIRQKRGFEKRNYTIDENSEFLEVDYSSLKEKLKYKVDLLEIGNDIEYEADNLIVGKISMIIFMLLSLGSISLYFFDDSENPGLLISSSIIWGALFLIGFLVPNKDDILITKGERTIRLFRDKPDEEQAMKFANTLIQLANNKKRTLLVNFELQEEQFAHNIQWLRHMKIISDAEMVDLKAEYQLKKLL